MRTWARWISLIVALLSAERAIAGPPYFTDDPAPTDHRKFEIYTFASGTHAAAGSDGTVGIDFNYGALKDLQLTAVLPVAYEQPSGGRLIGGVGNIEIAAKYRFLHQADIGIDVAIFPRVFLPRISHRLGENHASLLIPLWIQKDWGEWSAFGGGGCAINRGGDSQDYCSIGAAVTRQIGDALQVGVEIYHQSADTRGDFAATRLGIGIRYDVTDFVHLIASGGPGLAHTGETGDYSWYTALLFTF